MIRVFVDRSGGRISGYRVDGHAGTGKAGRDIVCAAVSALVQAPVLALPSLLGINPRVSSGDGFLECLIPKIEDEVAAIQVEAVLGAMLIGLREIGRQYPKALALSEKEV